MDEQVFYRDFERLVLRRDKLVASLLKHVEELEERGETDSEGLNRVIAELRKVRQELIRLISRNSSTEVSNEFSQFFGPLIEFSLTVSTDLEEELIRKLLKDSVLGDTGKLEEDLRELKTLSGKLNELSERLP